MRVVRRVVDAVLLVIAAAVLLVGGATALAPSLDGRVLAIRSGSMAPAIGVGSLVVVAPVDPWALRVGDVVTVEPQPGLLLTHRIEAIVEQDDRRLFRLHGDANPAADPVPFLADAVVGRVELAMPGLGYLLVMLATPSGIVGLVATFLLLLLGVWILEDLEAEAEEEAELERIADGPRPSPRPASP